MINLCLFSELFRKSIGGADNLFAKCGYYRGLSFGEIFVQVESPIEINNDDVT